MTGNGQKKRFRTLRGFISGYESDEEIYFAYSASLRIFSEHLDFEDINKHLMLLPTYIHRKGDLKGPGSPPFPHDMWQFSPNLGQEIELAEQIDALWKAIKPAKEYLLSLKRIATVDVFLGYRSNNDMAGFAIPYTCLEMFVELQIPFGVSIIITSFQPSANRKLL